jgi:hypothetical protein
MMQVNITDFRNVNLCSPVEVHRFLEEPIAFTFHPKYTGSLFLQNAGKIYQIHGLTVLVVVEAVVVTFPENERYEMPTPCVLN